MIDPEYSGGHKVRQDDVDEVVSTCNDDTDNTDTGHGNQEELIEAPEEILTTGW